jgi:hypothetical protein
MDVFVMGQKGMTQKYFGSNGTFHAMTRYGRIIYYSKDKFGNWIFDEIHEGEF